MFPTGHTEKISHTQTVTTVLFIQSHCPVDTGNVARSAEMMLGILSKGVRDGHDSPRLLFRNSSRRASPHVIADSLPGRVVHTQGV
jgi:hypothetical protein